MYDFCSRWVNRILSVLTHGIPKQKVCPSRGKPLEGVFSDTALDVTGKIFRVVFGIPLKDGFKDNSLRRVRHGLFRIVDSHTVLFELCLVDSRVIAITSETVKGIHYHRFKLSLFAVFNETLKARTVICFAGNRPVNVFIYDGEPIFKGKLVTFSELTLYRFLSLVVARISSVNYRFRSLTSNSRFR